MRTALIVSLAVTLSAGAANAFPPISNGTVIPGPPAAAPQVALTASTTSTVCIEVSAQQGVNKWVFNPGNASFYYVLNPSHGSNPNLFPPIPSGHTYNPVGAVAGTAFAQADCGAGTGALSKKVYYQDWACWAGTVKAGGGNCFTTTTICPVDSHATLVGGDCKCLDPAFPIEDATARTCRVDPCTLLNCDDGKTCTVDRCSADAGCSNTVEDAGSCTCSGTPPPFVSFSTSTQADIPPIACPIIGGDLKASVEVASSGMSQGPGCTNGCTAQASLSGSAALSASFCHADTLTLTGTSTTGFNRVHPQTCNASTCGSDCGSGYCGTTTTSDSIALRQTRFAGTDFKKPFPGGGKLSFKCGGTLSANGSVASSTSTRQAVGQAPPCIDCVNKDVTLTAGATAGLTCALNVSTKLATAEFGCKDCFTASVTMSGTRGQQSGSCGSQGCSRLSSNVSIGGQLPRTKMSFLWWSVETACHARIRGCGESNTCGACTCGNGTCAEVKTDVDCTVCKKDSALAPCVR